MGRPVFKSIQWPRVLQADAVWGGEALELSCAIDRSSAAATKDADRTTGHSRDLGLAVVAGWCEARLNAVKFLIFSPALGIMDDAGSIGFYIHSNLKGCVIYLVEATLVTADIAGQGGTDLTCWPADLN